MEIPFCSHIGYKPVATTQISAWHNSYDVVACAKHCSDLMPVIKLQKCQFLIEFELRCLSHDVKINFQGRQYPFVTESIHHFGECGSKLKSILSNTFFAIYGLCVFTLLISLVMIVKICVRYLIIIIKSKVWIISRCLGLDHEKIVGAVSYNVLTVYPKKYAHGFVVLCFVVVM